jgi:tetratricopeptide (TPR) repeat protein
MAVTAERPRWPRLVAVLMVLLLAFAGTAGAESGKKKKRQFTVTETMGKKLVRAQEAMVEERWSDALTTLKSSETRADRGRLSAHERALVYQFLSLIAAQQQQYPTALENMEKCLAQDALPDRTQLGVMFNVAQIHLALEQYGQAVTALERWFKTADEPTSQAYYLLAVAHYQQTQLDRALAPAKQAVALARAPKESWLQLLVGLYLGKERYADALPHVETLVTNFPKKSYYAQLSALYSMLDQDEKSLALMQLSYEQGFLTSDRELRRLGQMYLYLGLPQRAAAFMEKAMAEQKVEIDAKSLELLANSRLVARDLERAIEPLARAAEMSEEGDVYVRLGQIYLEREDWDAAADALSKGLERGVKKEGKAQLLLGIAYYNRSEPKNARRAFRAARKFEDSKTGALRWIEMLE